MRHPYLESMAAAQSPRELYNPWLCEYVAQTVGSVSPCYALLEKNYRGNILRGRRDRGILLSSICVTNLGVIMRSSIDLPETVAAHGEHDAKARDRTVGIHNAVGPAHAMHPCEDKRNP